MAEAVKYRIGNVECVPLIDGEFTYPATWFVSNVDPGELNEKLREHNEGPDQIVSPYTCLLIDTGDHKVLVDTGAGGLAPTTGKLVEAMEANGVQPDQIDTVILTHAHPDHAGGNLDADGRPAFRNARHVMSKTEWEFWTAPEIDLGRTQIPDEMKAIMVDTARRFLPPIEPQLELMQGETEVVPGVHLVPAPGHTPGHCAVLVSSGSEQLLALADAVIHPLYLDHPEWRTMFDYDQETAAETRLRLLNRAAADDMLVLGFHFPGSRAGKLRPVGENRWRWEV